MSVREKYKNITPTEFAAKVAKTMKKIGSSHVYFILQEALGWDLDWTEVEYLLDKVVKEAKKDTLSN